MEYDEERGASVWLSETQSGSGVCGCVRGGGGGEAAVFAASLTGLRYPDRHKGTNCLKTHMLIQFVKARRAPKEAGQLVGPHRCAESVGLVAQSQ